MLSTIFSSSQLQFFGGLGNEVSFIIYIASFVVLMFVSILWAPRIQASMVLNDVNKNLLKLQTLRENSRKELVDYITSVCKAPPNSQSRIDQALEYFTIMPVSLDPRGIVDKIEHVVRTQDDRVRAELKTIAPEADPVQISAAQNILEVASSLNIIFKVVRHMFIQGKKTKSLFLIVQLQMTMPTLIQQAEALFNAIEAFRAAQPIGDGIGPMVAGQFMIGSEKTGIEQETVYAVSKYKDRMLYVLKAEGPMGTVGRPHSAVRKLVEDPNTKIGTIIMIDAALKLEGEKTGDVAEGIGAAIGGVGVERAKIEDIAVLKDIPVYAIVVKQSLIDAISVMTKEIAESAPKVVDRVHALVEDKTKEGDSVLVIGVGNTLGVAQ